MQINTSSESEKKPTFKRRKKHVEKDTVEQQPFSWSEIGYSSYDLAGSADTKNNAEELNTEELSKEHLDEHKRPDYFKKQDLRSLDFRERPMLGYFLYSLFYIICEILIKKYVHESPFFVIIFLVSALLLFITTAIIFKNIYMIIEDTFQYDKEKTRDALLYLFILLIISWFFTSFALDPSAFE